MPQKVKLVLLILAGAENKCIIRSGLGEASFSRTCWKSNNYLNLKEMYHLPDTATSHH